MRPSVARAILTAQGRPAVYTSPAGEAVSIRARLRDVDKEIRVSRTADLIGSDAVATVGAEVAPRRGGVLEFGDTAYRIDGIVRSGAPGLVDLALTRTAGAGRDMADFSTVILPLVGEMVSIDGRAIRAHVNRSGLVVEEDGFGNPIEVLRHSIAIASADGEGVRAGSIVTIDGRERAAIRVLRDGLGMIRIIC